MTASDPAYPATQLRSRMLEHLDKAMREMSHAIDFMARKDLDPAAKDTALIRRDAAVHELRKATVCYRQLGDARAAVRSVRLALNPEP